MAARARAAPSARKAMAESGIEPGDVKGSGRGGRISKQDVDRAVEERTSTAPRAVETRAPEPVELPAVARASVDIGRERVVPMSPLRRTVARRLVEAQQTAAILTTFNEVDMTSVHRAARALPGAVRQAHGIKLGFMSFFVKAVVDALKSFPAVNGEVRGNDIIYKDHYDIGVAVGGGKGLVVPVVRNADRLSFAEVERPSATWRRARRTTSSR